MSLPTLVVVSDDELQDYLVQKLELERGDGGFRREVQAEAVTIAWGERMILSSNPTASQHFYFPVKADNTEFVSLDLDEAWKMSGATKNHDSSAYYRDN